MSTIKVNIVSTTLTPFFISELLLIIIMRCIEDQDGDDEREVYWSQPNVINLPCNKQWKFSKMSNLDINLCQEHSHCLHLTKKLVILFPNDITSTPFSFYLKPHVTYGFNHHFLYFLEDDMCTVKKSRTDQIMFLAD